MHEGFLAERREIGRMYDFPYWQNQLRVFQNDELAAARS
jgi:hypothetical protein